MRHNLILVSIFLSSVIASAQDTPEKHILAVLSTQMSAWNRGDIHSFMEGYANSDSIRFVSGTGITLGFDKVLSRYLRTYPDKNKMGYLSFKDIKVTLISESYAIVVGNWRLDRPMDEGGNLGGFFTLIFRDTDKGWKIIHDHTS